MRRNREIILILVLCLILAGCGNNTDASSGSGLIRPEDAYSGNDEVNGSVDKGNQSGNDESNYGVTESGDGSGDATSSADDPDVKERLLQQGFIDVSKEPYGKYRSEEELLAILQGIEADSAMDMPEYQIPEMDPEVKEMVEYKGKKETATFDESLWEEPDVIFTYVDLGIGDEVEEDSTFVAGEPANEAWTASELTKGLPYPTGGVSQVIEEPGYLGVFSSIVDDTTFRDYVKAVKDIGFKKNIWEEDYTPLGIIMVTYEATNQDGRIITLTQNNSSFMIEITK